MTRRKTNSARSLLAPAALLALGACTTTLDGTGDPDSGSTRGVAEAVALAAPNQNLQSVRLLDDGCYWYRHAGPVETTWLPLRTPDGSTICLRRSPVPQTA